MLTALAFVLMLVSKQIPAPWLQGGSITICSMVPIVMVSVLAGTKWGLASGISFSLIQMMTGFYAPPVPNLLSFVAVIMLDYILAFGVLGLAGFFVKLMGKKAWAIPVSGAIVTALRFVMHILSGVLIWSYYAGETNALIYSLTYNGSYMIPEIIITTVTLALIAPKIKNKIA